MTEKVVGRGCDRPMEVCMGMGPLAELSIRSGRMRRVDLKEALAIKAEAEASGLVSWIDNQDPKIGGDILFLLRMLLSFYEKDNRV